MSLPKVTVIVPARNEARYILTCLASIVSGDYPPDRLEILVVDGNSDDSTRVLVQQEAANHSCIRLLDNPQRTVPYAMNIGIRAAQGDVIVRMDAHARYGPGYVRQLVEALRDLNADNVGGVWVTHPANDSAQAVAVAAILSHPFGIGNASYRLGLDGPRQVDTVPFGCYRRDVFERIGYYDEIFTRNQDDELNARLRRSGGRIFLIPSVKIDYYARESLRKMGLMLYQYGYFKPLVAMKVGRPATARQFAPPLFVVALLGLPVAALILPIAGWLWGGMLAVHTAANIWVSAVLARKRGWRTFPFLCLGFLWAHVAYGGGYLRGILDFGILRRHREGADKKVSLSR